VDIELRALSAADLPRARALLAASCSFDPAAEVAEEKLFGAAPAGPAPAATDGNSAAIGAFRERGTAGPSDLDMVGVTATSQRWIRLLAVHPEARGRGIGSVLLAAAESRIAGRGAQIARTLDQPGNYLAPGIDARNLETIGWLERRGYRRLGENTNLLIDVSSNPKVSEARAAELAERAAEAGYDVRRARASDRAALSAAIAPVFSRAWAYEVERALDRDRPSLHLAVTRDGGELAAFAAHDGNNRGLGWFGPAGTFQAHRRHGLGEALLIACLVDVAAAGLPTCTIAWIGPRSFYQRAAGLNGERRFLVLGKDLTPEAAA
jgi:GNAT superfamily N-acetyltransferase